MESNYKLLVVDPMRSVHERVAAVFFRDDYILEHAFDAASAVRKVWLAPRDHDALVLGDHGPGHDAIQFLDDLRARLGPGGHPPVILLWSLTGVKQAAASRGVHLFADKSSDVADLRAAVRQAFAEAWRAQNVRLGEEGPCECGARHTSFPHHHSSWCPARSG